MVSFTQEERKQYIGGSDISVVMGMNRWKTPLKLWLEKTGEIEPDDLSKVEAVHFGTKLEDIVAKEFAERNNLEVRQAPKMYTHKDYPFMAAHIDRIVTNSDALLECKTCSTFKDKEWDGNNIPQEYVLQVMWYLGITGRKKGYIACLVGGQKYIQKEIEFDQEMFDIMVQRAIEFWDKVQKNEPPEITANDGETLALMFPKSSMEIIENVPPEIDEAIARRQSLKQEQADVEKELKEVETVIKDYIKGNLGLQTQKYIVTWKEYQGKETVDTAKLKNDGLFEKYKKIGKSYRMLKVTNNPEFQPIDVKGVNNGN